MAADMTDSTGPAASFENLTAEPGSYRLTVKGAHQTAADGDIIKVTVDDEVQAYRVITATPLGEGGWSYDLEPVE